MEQRWRMTCQQTSTSKRFHGRGELERERDTKRETQEKKREKRIKIGGRERWREKAGYNLASADDPPTPRPRTATRQGAMLAGDSPENIHKHALP